MFHERPKASFLLEIDLAVCPESSSYYYYNNSVKSVKYVKCENYDLKKLHNLLAAE